jgi:hypothetical protein
MRYFAVYDENNSLVSVGRGYGGTEITEAEYDELLSMIRKKAAFVNALYNGEITISEVPAEWQAEIQRRLDERRAWEEENAEEEATEKDYLSALAELGVTVNEES